MEDLEDYYIERVVTKIRCWALACPDCHQPPTVEFNPSSQEFKISCCGYSVEIGNASVALELWGNFVKAKIAESRSRREL